MKSNYVIYGLIILILFLLFFNPNWIWLFKKYLNYGYNDQNLLEKENLILKSKLVELQSLEKFKNDAQNEKNIKPAFVFSRYPFNFKSEILINLGQSSGIKINDAVVLPDNDYKFLLLGRIKEIFDNFSIVQTIFDPDFKIAVKIGLKTNALLEGGIEPKINLIPKEAEVLEGDLIYSVDSSLPYGLIIGQLGKIKNLNNNLFNAAQIIVPYKLNQLNIVGIIK